MQLNDLGRKLIRDGSDRVRLRVNLKSISIGVGLLFPGIVCVIAGAFLRQGGAERFLLLPAGAVLTLCGAAVIAAAGIHSTVCAFHIQGHDIRRRCLSGALVCLSVTLGYIAAIMLLLEANSGSGTFPVFIFCSAAAVLASVFSVILKI